MGITTRSQRSINKWLLQHNKYSREREMEGNKSRILIFGGTGYTGKCMVKASISLGHPTFVYTRPLNSQTPPSKIQLCHQFNSVGVNLVQVISYYYNQSN